MDRALRDGYEVHRAALAHGYDVTLLPRQVMEVQGRDRTLKTSFSHGVPQQSTLAGVTYAQDVRMRRDMVMRAGYTVPTGATFSMGGSKRTSFKYAGSTLEYPVVVKPAVGDNTVDVITDIQNLDDLQKAVELFQIPPAERPGHTRAAYGLTELREPTVEDGKVMVPPGYRFLVENQVKGQYLRFLVLGGEVINVLLCPNGPWKSCPQDIQDVTQQTHASLKSIAAGAAEAIPGIAVAAVDLVVDSYDDEVEAKDAPIVEYSERPWLAVQHLVDPELAGTLGAKILAHGLENELSASQQSVSIGFTVDGSVHPDELVDVLTLEFQRTGLTGKAHVSDQALGHISGSVKGDPAEIAFIMESMLDEGIQGQRAMLVEQRHRRRQAGG